MKKIFHSIRLLVIIILLVSCKKSSSAAIINIDTLPHKTFYNWSTFVMGSDLSIVNQVEDYGGIYKDSGVVKDPYAILKAHGNNVVRVRLWNNPQWQAALNKGHLYSDIKDVEKTMARAKALGMAVCLDLHYADTWADPAHQSIPAAWEGLNLATLEDSVYNYTTYVLNYFKARNLTPEMIQIGNETNQGMLWPTGKVAKDDFTPFGALLQSGIKAVRNFSTTSTVKPQIILHVAQVQNADYFANGIINLAGVTDFDIIGISHYVDYTTLTSMNQVSAAIGSLRRKYNKKVMIVEASYPWTTENADSYPNIAGKAFTTYPVTPDGQYQYMKDLTQEVISGGGSGIIYWEPCWITSSLKDLWGTGSSWDNNTFFDFSGNALPAIDYMNYKYIF